MLSSHVHWALLTAASTFVPGLHAQNTNNATASSIFVSSTQDVAFSLNVPEDSSTDLYFSLAFPSAVSYGAVGLGTDKMKGSLMLIAYSSGSGKNTTISPRLATGHTEPVYSADIQIESLSGTGLVNESVYVFNGRCTNCRSWNGGSIDVTSTSQEFAWAAGPGGEVRSDDPSAGLKMHYDYGSFTMDMKHATGAAGVSPILSDAQPVATIQGDSESGKRDWSAAFHAVVMVFCFVGLFPLGIGLLRIGGWVRWHGINQTLFLLGVIIGSGLGIYISFEYNRSKNFSNPHQIMGLLVLIFVIAQFVLGFMHHRIYQRTQTTTKLAPVHVWLGRVILFLGVINAFLGFPFALSPHYNFVLAGLCIFIFPILAIGIATKDFIRSRLAKRSGGPLQGSSGGYNMEPWRQERPVQTGYQPNPFIREGEQQYDPNPNPSDGSTEALSSHADYQSRNRKTELGPQQSTTEYV